MSFGFGELMGEVRKTALEAYQHFRRYRLTAFGGGAIAERGV